MNLGAKRLKEYLDRRGLSQAKMAEALGVTEATMSRTITGKTIPDLDLAVSITRHTNGYVVPADFLILESKEPSGPKQAGAAGS